ncbi:MAG: hypothetical protein ABI347_02955 [Nitrososphaera sp.]|jgi:DNA-directed RNA polymerase subunit RPC12/RpoP
MSGKCPACSHRLYEYKDGKWTEWICWRCGHYNSDTPAFQAQPHLFRDIVRKNGHYFMAKYSRYTVRLVSKN